VTGSTTSTTYRQGARRLAPFGVAAAAFAASFAVLAPQAGFDAVSTIVMSATTFAGSAQFGAVSVLETGGGVAAAIAAAVLLNARYAPISVTVGDQFEGSVLRRLLEAQLIVDESWALSRREDGRYDRRLLIGGGLVLYACWVGGTALGAVIGNRLGDPERYGLDAAFPALFLALLITQIDSRRALAAALAGGTIALVLIPFAPPGVPIIAATAACLIGWIRP
jgi:4-azaleucine resistance transporter AzlC